MNKFVYNGKEADSRNLISVYNGSFLYGINCFEGLRGYWYPSEGKLYLLDLERHLDRLFQSANRLKFNCKFSKDEIRSELNNLLDKHSVCEDIYIRITLFLDNETSWIERENISYVISIRSMSSSLAVDSSDKSYSLYIPRTLRTSESSMPPSIKAGGNYLNSRYAKLEAIENGFDDALLVNHQGFISESTGSCVFFIMDNALLTPSLDCDILASITRHRIITICRQNGVKVLEGKFRSDDIQEIQGAFLCGSMIELMPISRIGSLKMATVDLKLYQSVLKLFKNSINTENL